MKRKNAFTLVELLVVVSVIVLLLALLLPTVSRSVQAGQRVQCASNERQINLAGLNYTNDNHRKLPVGAGPTPGWSPTWDQLLLPYGSILELILCPSQKEGTRHYWVNSNYDNSHKNWGDERQTGMMSLGFSVRPEDPTRPNNTVTWMEMRYRYAGFADGGLSVPGGGWASIAWDYQDYFIMQYQHMKKANFTFADGHVELLDEEEATGADGAGGYSLEIFTREQ